MSVLNLESNPHRHRNDSGSSDDEEKEYDIHQARCDSHRKKIGLPRQKKLQFNLDGNQEKQTDQLIQFVQSHFAMKECVRYVPKGDKPSDSIIRPPCCCGETYEHHYRDDTPMQHGNLGSSYPRSTMSSPSKSLILTPEVAQMLLTKQQANASQNSLPFRSRNAVHPDLNQSNLTVPIEQLSATNTPRLDLNSFPFHTRKPPEYSQVAYQNDQAGLINNAAPMGSTIPTLPPINTSYNGGILFTPRIQIQDEYMSVTQQYLRTGTIQQVPWTAADCIREFSTNAFGKMEFANEESSSKPAKYVRLSDTANLDDVVELMDKYWLMTKPHKPYLVISVVGGAKNFKLDGKKRETFNRGLVKAAQSTGAWLVTSGCYMGVMKAVGEAVKEEQSLELGHTRISHTLRCIGIAPWGYILNHHSLESDNPGRQAAAYPVDPLIRHGRPVSLDPNHTHFIMVDDGYRNSLRPKVADFRANLERRIAEKLKIPVVVVLVEGGVDSIDFVLESVTKGIPVVICQGTGRAADIFAYAFNHSQSHGKEATTDVAEEHKVVIKQKLEAAFGKTFEGDKLVGLTKAMQKIIDCCKDENMLTVFDLNRNEDLDLAILSALLKGQGTGRLEQLQLALRWNRSDVASEKIFTDSEAWKPGELDDIMFEALATDKVTFVKLLLQHGVVMKDFLTVKRLRRLYNAAPKHCYIRQYLKNLSQRETYTLKHVQVLIKKLMHRAPEAGYEVDDGDAFRSDFVGQVVDIEDIKNPINDAKFQKPFKELFLWSVLMSRQELAKFFWERGDNAVISAIAATKIYGSLAKIVNETDGDKGKELEAHCREFEDLAISVVDRAFTADFEKALLIVEQPYEVWCGYDCLQLATAVADKKFLASACVQTSVSQNWKRGIICSGSEVVFALLFPIYIITRMRFDSAALGSPASELNFFQKGKIFYSAPITKFCYWTMSYLVFLVVYSYVLLFDYRYQIEITEILLHIWVGSTIADNLRLMIVEKLSGNSSIIDHINSSAWNRIEYLGLLTHLLGFTLRWISPECFEISRFILCLAVILFYLRLMRVYMASNSLGPHLFVIQRMLKDVVMFLMLLGVFMTAYAVASQALVYINRPFYWGILTDLFYYPYWQLFGELQLEESIEGKLEGCLPGNVTNEEGLYCPRHYWPVSLFLGAYLLIGNILLINLLIAIFSSVFEEVQKHSTEIWKFEMWNLMKEYDEKPFLPPPMVVSVHLVRMLKWIFVHKGKMPKRENAPLSRRQTENLKIFEKDCLNEFLHMRRQQKEKEMHHQVTTIQERLDKMVKTYNDDRAAKIEQWAHHRALQSRESRISLNSIESTSDKRLNRKDSEVQLDSLPPMHTKLGVIGRSPSIVEEDLIEEVPMVDTSFDQLSGVPKLEITEDYQIVASKDECEETDKTSMKPKRKRDGPSTRQKVAFMQERMEKLEKDNSEYLRMIQRLEKLLNKTTTKTNPNTSDSDSDKGS